MRFRHGILISVVAALLGLPALALDPAGSAVDVLPAATGELQGTTIDLSKGDSIYMGQQIVTGPNGQVQIIFQDDTHLVVGPSSTLVIAEYLMRNAGSASKFVVDALGGTFRFATGNSAKNAYEIRTPTGTIGVRGTVFDFDVDRRDGEVHVLLYHGAVIMCATGRECVTMTETCALGRIPEQDTAEIFEDSDQRQSKVKADFPYLNQQSPLRRDFRVANIAKCKAPPPLVAELNECPPGYSGDYPDCVAPTCPDGYTGSYPDCEPLTCPSGYTGTYPNCEPPTCPSGYTGTYPNCQPPQCPSGYTGTYPNCQPPSCPSGYTGTYPNCQPPSCPSGYTGTYPDCDPPKPPDEDDDEDEDEDEDDDDDDDDHDHDDKDKDKDKDKDRPRHKRD